LAKASDTACRKKTNNRMTEDGGIGGGLKNSQEKAGATRYK